MSDHPDEKTPSSNPHQSAMRNLIGANVKCTLDDGRTATGSLVCVDRLKNLILTDVLERRSVHTSVYAPNAPSSHHKTIVLERALSQAMIPGKHLVKVEIPQDVYEEKVEPFLLV